MTASTIDRTLSTYLVTLASLHSLYQSQKHKNKSDLVKCQAINLTLTFFFWTYFFSNFCLVLNYPTQRIYQASDLLSLSLFCYCRQVTISQFFFREEGRSVLNLPHHQVGASPTSIREGGRPCSQSSTTSQGGVGEGGWGKGGSGMGGDHECSRRCHELHLSLLDFVADCVSTPHMAQAISDVVG